jgi:hypothetical protein
MRLMVARSRSISSVSPLAVYGFGGMQKQGRASGGAQRGGDLLRDDTALAHASDDDAAACLSALDNEIDGSLEVCGHGAFKTGGELLQCFCFNANELCRGVLRHIVQTFWMVSNALAARQVLAPRQSAGASRIP